MAMRSGEVCVRFEGELLADVAADPRKVIRACDGTTGLPFVG